MALSAAALLGLLLQTQVPADLESTVRAPGGEVLDGDRATDVVRADELAARLPRSAPDALRDLPGVFIQQTAHGQASPYVRGLTGQQTVLLFDGIRIDSATWRQGPNQYAFTLDARTLESLEVQRGGASTRWGAGALGGVVSATPRSAPDPRQGDALRPALYLRGTTADGERGGRVELGVARFGWLSLLAGVGRRDVAQLESAGVLKGLAGTAAEVPRLAADGRTQLGTGFSELTADLRLEALPTESLKLVAAVQAYRQYDAPRTDQCPPAGARFDECLTYEEQFRTLAWLRLESQLGAFGELKAHVAWQRQHERRKLDRPGSFTVQLGRDDDDTTSAGLLLRTRPLALGAWSLRGESGLDAARDVVESVAFLRFDDLDLTLQRSRGQYLDGATQLRAGAFVRGEARLGELLVLTLGTRLERTSATAPGDPDSGTAPVDRAWWPLAAEAGVRLQPTQGVALSLHADRSFRTPNLDDLTARQQTGAGFQFENAALTAERATTLEAGVEAERSLLSGSLFAFVTRIDGAIARASRGVPECPLQTPNCGASRARFQLVNAEGPSLLRGLEGRVRVRLPLHLRFELQGSWARGDGPDLSAAPGSERATSAVVPLSRVPPLHGAAELAFRHPVGLQAALVLRAAAAQDRLALADAADFRIPTGGTPGYAVLDLRLGMRIGPSLWLRAVLENLGDAVWRAHGSSVNGPGRGLLAELAFTPRL